MAKVVRGFFSNTGDQSLVKPPVSPVLQPNCNKCGLYKGCISPKMPVSGQGKLKILSIGEAPGGTEDERNTQMIGDAGQLYRRILSKFHLDLDRDFYKHNALACRPPENRKPHSVELKCCRPNMEKLYQELKPKAVWLMGDPALESHFQGYSFDNLKITTWRGRSIPDYRYNFWVVPMLHFSFILRNEKFGGNSAVENIFTVDIAHALDLVNTPLPPKENYESKVSVLTKYEDVMALLRGLDQQAQQKEIVMFYDYETTGLKPYKPGHKILSISLSISPEQSNYTAYSFPLRYKNHFTPAQITAIERMWKRLLLNPRIAKGGQNTKFEEKWNRSCLGVEAVNVFWCTMIASHILDNQGIGCTGLKFQVFTRWGVTYEDDVKAYRQSVPGTQFNRLEEFPLEKLLLYGGLDSLFTNMLQYQQELQFMNPSNKGLCYPYELFLQGTEAFADMEEQGIPVNEKYYAKALVDVSETADAMRRRLSNSDAAQLFKTKTGKDLDIDSYRDLSKLFFDIMALKPVKLTEHENPSVDEEAMASIDHPFAKRIVLVRKQGKIKNYIADFYREIYQGVMHPNFNLNTARSYRSSADSPNFQNIPIRDEEAKKWVRSGIIPSPGFYLAAGDFKAIEVCVMAMQTHDDKLIEYIKNPKSDMHKDQAAIIWICALNNISYDMRFYTKNKWTFAQFYGSYWRSCAKTLWAIAPKIVTVEGQTAMDHLQQQGIKNLRHYELYLKGCERKLWQTYAGVKKWQEENLAFYNAHGYIETLMGFRRSGVLSRNQVVNTPIQATAFHLLLWCLIQLNRRRKVEKWRTRIPGQIHDNLYYDMCPEEGDYVFGVSKQIMEKDVVQQFPFINVPLTVKFDKAEIDQPWYSIKEMDDDLSIEFAAN